MEFTKKDFIFMFHYVYMYVSVWVCKPEWFTKARKGFQIPWCWSYRWLLVSKHRFWDMALPLWRAISTLNC